MVDRHKQQIKRDRQDLKRRAINSQNKSKMRTLIKSVLSEKDPEKAKNLYGDAVSFIDKILKPRDCKDLKAVSLPDPGPFT